ncbi:MAG TPA: hypothetical protein EYG88_10910 [Desulfocapsa sulfexigens]|nr:hypothetical protein [Desulfocapsa sulfexigens]
MENRQEKKALPKNVAAEDKRRMEKGVTTLLACIVFLGVSIAMVLSLESGNRKTAMQEAQQSFQAAVGGMGMGATTVPAWNFGDFDPRLQPGSYDRLYPIPGGYSYSPDRLTMVSNFQDR